MIPLDVLAIQAAQIRKQLEAMREAAAEHRDAHGYE